MICETIVSDWRCYVVVVDGETKTSQVELIEFGPASLLVKQDALAAAVSKYFAGHKIYCQTDISPVG